MNELGGNTVYTAAVLVPEQEDELELDLRDMLATLLLKWKTVLICLLAGALALGLYTLRSAPRTQTVSFVTEEDVFDARQAVSEARAAAIERLYERVVFYRAYLESIEREYAVLLDSQSAGESAVVLRGSYYVSSDIDNIGSYFTSSPLSEADYAELRAIAPASADPEDIYRRVTVSGLSAATDEGAAYDGRADVLFTVTVSGDSLEQCTAMLDVAERSLRQKANYLHSVDPTLEMQNVGDRMTYDAQSYLKSRQDDMWNRYTNAESRLNDQQNKAKALTGAEKNYYQKLEQLHNGDATVSTAGRSLKKWTLIGAVIGLFAGVVVVFWPYLFDGRVKTAGELEASHRGMVLSRVSVKGKRNLFGRWAASLTGADNVDPGVKADMLAADLSILMEKGGQKAVYLLCNAEDTEAAALAEQVRARLLEKAPGAAVTVGNPLSAVEELSPLGTAELGVMFAQLKQTRRSVLRQWQQLCSRYSLPVAGAVTVQKCW